MGNNRIALLDRLNKIEQLSKGSRWARLFYRPFHYLNGILFWKLKYNTTKKGSIKHCTTFFNSTMDVVLPAGMDLYLLGAKSHDSEIRLAKYMIRTIKEGQVVLDIGTHFGYYALLAHHLVGEEGRVIGIEASPSTFNIMTKNAQANPQLEVFNLAATSKEETISFFEFPILYSEYNTIYPKQFEETTWLAENKPQQVAVNGIPMDNLLKESGTTPDFIKIDVEGAEYDVLLGLRQVLQKNTPIIAMEYLANKKTNQSHKKAIKLLTTYDYLIHLIDKDGQLRPIATANLERIFQAKNVESDNIIFRKKIH